jgi:putative nucleotidyltransferase with HDIG domain
LFARYDEATGEIEIAYALAAGERQKDWEKTTIPPDQGGGLLGWIINHQQSLLIDDVVQETLPVPPSPSERDIRSWLGVPLLVGDRVVGAMVVQSHQESDFRPAQKQLLELLASQAAIAFENSRLYDQAQRRMKRIASLREVDRAISGTVDLQTTLEVLIGQLSSTLDVDAAAVLLFQPSMQTLEYVVQRGFKTEAARPDNLLLGESPAGKTALRRRLIHIRSLTEYEIEGTDYLVQQGFETYLGVPLIAKGDLVGVLEVCQRSRKEISQEWLDFLEALADQAAIAIDRLNLFNDLNRTNLELIQAYDATIEGWARAIELRDVVTEGHSRRVEEMTVKLAARMGVNEKALAHIRRGALLHDIGKMAIPDSILLKEGKLNEEEWGLMKKHPVYAYEMLSRIDFLRPALSIPYAHHEWWDGSGYPRGLSGEEIPLEARIFAVVDVWDALQSDRPYRKAWSEEKTLSYLREQAGTQFDPQVVEIFLNFLQG